MTDLLLIFLCAAGLEDLVLVMFIDRAVDPASKPVHSLRVSGAILLAGLAALQLSPLSWQPPTPASTYLQLLVFVTLSVAMGPPRKTHIDIRLRRPQQARMLALRVHLPLLVANVAVLLFALLDHRRPHYLAQTLGFCAVASLALLLVRALFSSLQERLAAADLPAMVRGTPIALLTAGIMSLAAMGFARWLP